jgi:hypothetical protein
MTTEVEQATKTLNTLMDQREQLVGRSGKLASERQKISYAAHTGDKGAKERLRKINDESVLHNAELEGVDAAIVEANARLAIAQANAALAADRVNAEALRGKVERFVELGLIVDDCFADLNSAAAEMKTLLSEMHNLGAAAASHDQLRVLGGLALKTALMETPWAKEFEHIAPNQRRSFKALVSAWHDQLMPGITARLGETKQEEQAA